MTALTLPAADAPAEEWGRLAVSLPGWRWMPGMRAVDSTGEDTPGRVFDSSGCVVFEDQDRELTEERVYLCDVPDSDDPATAGCLLRLLESEDISLHSDGNGSPIYLDWWDPKTPMNDPIRFEAPTIGRVCIMVAVHLGRWPGGAE